MLESFKLIQLPKIFDERGNLSFLENENQVPFIIKRVYWIYDVPGGEVRGGHAFKQQQEFIIALSGSFDVILNDGEKQQTITLNKPDKGLLIKSNIWRELENFSSGSVCLVISSGEFLEDDYIRNFDKFLEFSKANRT